MSLESTTTPLKQVANGRQGRRLELADVLADLVADGLLTPEDAKLVADGEGESRPKTHVRLHPLVVIGNKRLKNARPPHKPLTTETLTVWLARKTGIPYERIDPLKIDVNVVTGVMPYAYASRHKILPISVTDQAITIVSCEPYITDWVEELGRAQKKKIVRVLANPQDIGRYLDEYYNLSRSVMRASNKAGSDQFRVIANVGRLVEMGATETHNADDSHIVAIVDWLLQYAFEQRASDIHIEPRTEKKGDIRFRIDGSLYVIYQLPSEVMNAVTSRIKTLGRMDIGDKRLPHDGRMRTRTPDGDVVELRLSTIPTPAGEKMVIRIFDPGVLQRSYQDLGLDGEDLARWKSLARLPYGIILVTGPTGSGKTTTLYSTLRHLATPDVNVCTIEDPIEMIEPTFNQMQVQHAIGLDFANGVRALLRQDPDIIMIGEIRDLETAQMAVQAALTGHLVLASMHTNDSTSAVTRLLEIGVLAYQIKATLLGVVAQRLVRTLCPHCKQPGEVDDAAWRAFVHPCNIPMPSQVYVPQGCLECHNTGYLGRIGIYETLAMSSDLRRFVRPETDVTELCGQAIKEGLRPLRYSGIKKIHAGLTTVEEVISETAPFDESFAAVVAMAHPAAVVPVV